MNIRPETKILEKYTSGKIFDIHLGNDFLNLTPKAKATKANINKWDYIELKSFSQKRKPSKN